MTFLLIALLLQASIPLKPRAALEDPAIANPVPEKAQKDYGKLWKRFLTGKEDTKLVPELDKLLKKYPDAPAALVVQAYMDLYAGRLAEAERRLQQVLATTPDDPNALFYLGELAYARSDYLKAYDLFTRLEARRSLPGVDMKKQRSLLLAMEKLLQDARRATEENRLADAETAYRQALRLAPQEAALHGQLADVLRRSGKSAEADAELRLQQQFNGTAAPTLVASDNTLTVNGDRGLEDLGRWGNQIERFREIQVSRAITREQLAALLTRYFPQLTELPQSSEVMTDIQGSWAEPAIRSVVSAGLLDRTANHTFQPAKTVTRGEFGIVLSRLTRVLGASATTPSPITPLDVVSSSPLHLELQPVLSYGLMSLDNAGNFNVAAEVSGKEAVNTAEKLLPLIHKKTP